MALANRMVRVIGMVAFLMPGSAIAQSAAAPEMEMQTMMARRVVPPSRPEAATAVKAGASPLSSPYAPGTFWVDGSLGRSAWLDTGLNQCGDFAVTFDGETGTVRCDVNTAAFRGGFGGGVMITPFLGVEASWNRFATLSLEGSGTFDGESGTFAFSARPNVFLIQGAATFSVRRSLVVGRIGLNHSSVKGRLSIDSETDGIDVSATQSGWGPAIGGAWYFPIRDRFLIGPSVHVIWIRGSIAEAADSSDLLQRTMLQLGVSARVVFPR